MRILNWNCGGGFFTKEKYKSILKYDADILIIQECSKPTSSITKEFKCKYQINKLLWEVNYKKEEIEMEDKCKENEHKKNIKQKWLAVFPKENIKLEKIVLNNECDEQLTWWSEEETKIPIIKNKCLKIFNPVYIENFNLLLLGIHAEAPEKPKRYQYIGQVNTYLEKNKLELEKYKKIIIAGDFNTGFKENDKEKYDEFIKSYDENYNLKNCIYNYSNEFIPTYYKSNKDKYINDFIFLSKFLDVEPINPDDWRIDISGHKKWGYVSKENKGSDHCPLIIEIK